MAKTVPAGWTGNIEDAIQELGMTPDQAQAFFNAHPEAAAGALAGTIGTVVSPTIAPVPSSSTSTSAASVDNTDPTQQPIVVTGTRLPDTDYRVRLKPFSGSAFQQVIGDNTDDNILKPLWATNGLLFPYTPSIQFSQDVDWRAIEVTHTNYESAAYSRTPAVSISVTGKFTAQTHAEGRYMLAALHFLRVVSKMYFGKAHAQTEMAGVPPPVLLFSGYGPYMFNDVRVVVKNHSYTFDDSVQMVSVKTGTGDIVQLPSLLNLTLTLQVVQTPRAQKDDFNLDEFRKGSLMKKGGWI